MGKLKEAHANNDKISAVRIGKAYLAGTAKEVDQAIAALITDLKQRDMLKDTIIVFGSEFGRTPGSQGSDGRDHHIYGFTVWLAGGGLKRGVVHGATDEIGFHAVENRHYVTDIHATILKQLGLDRTFVARALNETPEILLDPRPRGGHVQRQLSHIGWQDFDFRQQIHIGR